MKAFSIVSMVLALTSACGKVESAKVASQPDIAPAHTITHCQSKKVNTRFGEYAYFATVEKASPGKYWLSVSRSKFTSDGLIEARGTDLAKNALARANIAEGFPSEVTLYVAGGAVSALFEEAGDKIGNFALSVKGEVLNLGMSCQQER